MGLIVRNMVTLKFHQGTIVLKGYAGAVDLRCLQWDDRSRQWRAKALHYSEILAWLQQKSISYKNQIPTPQKLKLKIQMKIELREYQNEAIDAWIHNNFMGTVSLPTGSGKTWVALRAMEITKTSTLIVLPTIDLMNQWYDLISDAFSIDVGILGGGYHEIRDVTVSTYDSAYIHIEKYGSRFNFLIFDEVHHLPAATYSHVPEMSIAKHRLGLTATYERLDGLHGKLERLIGPLVYHKSIKELEGKHLAEYETMKISVDLTSKEKASYSENHDLYENFIREKQIKFTSGDMSEFLQKTAYDPDARKAFLARLACRKIITNAEMKVDILETLLKRHCKDRVLIFTESNDLVYKISELFLIPALTHHTKTIERKFVLDSFKTGRYSVLVTSKVLNEGVDVPNASVAIILGGSGSPVEHVQRLGRILRKSKDKQAILYELVLRGTKESQVSYRRRRSDAYQ